MCKKPFFLKILMPRKRGFLILQKKGVLRRKKTSPRLVFAQNPLVQKRVGKTYAREITTRANESRVGLRFAEPIRRVDGAAARTFSFSAKPSFSRTIGKPSFRGAYGSCGEPVCCRKKKTPTWRVFAPSPFAPVRSRRTYTKEIHANECCICLVLAENIFGSRDGASLLPCKNPSVQTRSRLVHTSPVSASVVPRNRGLEP